MLAGSAGAGGGVVGGGSSMTAFVEGMVLFAAVSNRNDADHADALPALAALRDLALA